MYNKVVWSEGMFLYPQHFQQQDRYFEFLVKNTLKLSKYYWGFDQLEIDKELLSLGKIGLKKCDCIFQDGTFVNAPDIEKLPSPLEIDPNTYNTVVYLGIPLLHPGMAEIKNLSENSLQLCRYQSQSLKVSNNTSDDLNDTNDIQVGNLSLSLFTNKEELKNYIAFPIATIIEVSNTRLVKLDDNFLPTYLNVKASSTLSFYLTEILGLISQRRENLVNQLSTLNDENLPEIEEILLLQILNQYEQYLQVFLNEERVSSWDLYFLLAQASAALSTYLSKDRKPPCLFLYFHNDFNKTFDPLLNHLREYLSHTIEQKILSILLEETSHNGWIAKIFDTTLLENSEFIIAISADMLPDELRQQIPSQLKVGSIESIHNLMAYALPGVRLTSLAVVPRRLPYYAGYVYFLLDKNHPEWQNIIQSKGFAFHLSGHFPGFKMEFLATSENF